MEKGPIDIEDSESISPIEPVQIQPQIQNIPEIIDTESVDLTNPAISPQQPTQPIVQSKPVGTLMAPETENGPLAISSLQNQQTTMPLPRNANNIPLIISIVMTVLVFIVFLVYLLFFINHKTNLDVLNKHSTDSIKSSDSGKTVDNQRLNLIDSSVSNSANSHVISNADSIESGWKQVSVGQTASCGISFDDKLYCWGGSLYGTFEADLGVSSELDKSTQPVAVVLSNGLDKEKIIK